jgi:hypothetical protein
MAARCVVGAWAMELHWPHHPEPCGGSGGPGSLHWQPMNGPLTSTVLRCMQNIKAPLNGDEAAIRKYAQEMEALRKKVRSGSVFVQCSSLLSRQGGDPACPADLLGQSGGFTQWQVGLPDHSEALEAGLEYQLHASHGDLRGFLANTAESRDFGEYSDVLGEPQPLFMG